MPTPMRRTGSLSGGKNRIAWVQRDLFRGLTWFKHSVEGGLEDVLQEVSTEAEAWMKENAPWTDRTTDARNSLSATPYKKGSTQGILLAHGVHYGRWLELRWAGRYAIVIPAMEVMGRRMMDVVATRTFDKANGIPIPAGDAFTGLD